MVLFCLGFSICLNIFLIVLDIITYKKLLPVYKSTSFDISKGIDIDDWTI